MSDIDDRLEALRKNLSELDVHTSIKDGIIAGALSINISYLEWIKSKRIKDDKDDNSRKGL